MENSTTFFQNRSCQYFPCHECENTDEFNCMFCYCPLYTLGDKCGGDFRIIEGNIKDCSNCMLAHSPEAAQRVALMFGKIKETENRIRDSKL